MDENNKIQSFGDMVNATDRLTRPWRIAFALTLVALVLTNAIWGFVHWKQLKYAYMTPEEWTQEQLYDEQAQNQSHTSGVTDGE